MVVGVSQALKRTWLLIQTVWNNLPLEKNVDYSPEGVAIDLNELLPKDRNYYTYMGSLTTPPCSEGVNWVVMEAPVAAAAAQLEAAATIIGHPNNRPVQPLNARIVIEEAQ